MSDSRAAGVLLHPTSLPGPHGIGDLGPASHAFADILARMGCRYWQVLPLGPTGYGDSPYQSFSAFAGSPLLLSFPSAPPLTRSAAAAPLSASDSASKPLVSDDQTTVDFAAVRENKQRALAAYVAAFTPDADFRSFCERNSSWLDDYALFMALKGAHDGAAWTAWDPGAALRDATALATWRITLAAQIRRFEIEQYLFDAQLASLRAHCHARGVELIGDLPIYVAHDSADVWSHRELFQLDETGALSVQAGVPPDYFSKTGQLWGNPLYAWDRHAEEGFAWWIARVRAAFTQFDMVRIDHFRGFASYWEVPGAAATAEGGRWVDAPGDALFAALRTALGERSIIAENLGDITPEVEALRARWGFPGMAVLQFAFDPDAHRSPFLPHNHVRQLVVYTGTHDNDTAVGWFNAGISAAEPPVASRGAAQQRAARYLKSDGRAFHWDLIRSALGSVGDVAIVPLQDLLGLGSASRMNLPGRVAGNWGWRFTRSEFTPEIQQRFRELVSLFERTSAGRE